MEEHSGGIGDNTTRRNEKKTDTGSIEMRTSGNNAEQLPHSTRRQLSRQFIHISGLKGRREEAE
jgi:hypothetical protein